MGILDGITRRLRKEPEPEPEKPRAEEDDSGSCSQGLRSFYIEGESKTPFCRRYSAGDPDELKGYLKGRAIAPCLDMGRFSIVPVEEEGGKRFYYRCDL